MNCIELKDYHVFTHNRKGYEGYRSGGICVLVRDNIVKSFTLLKTDSKLVKWFCLELNYFARSKLLICGLVDIPP